MEEYIIRWAEGPQNIVLKNPIIVSEGDEEAAVLKGICLLMQEVVRENAAIACEAYPCEGGINVSASMRINGKRKLVGEYKRIHAEKVWSI